MRHRDASVTQKRRCPGLRNPAQLQPSMVPLLGVSVSALSGPQKPGPIAATTSSRVPSSPTSCPGLRNPAQLQQQFHFPLPPHPTVVRSSPLVRPECLDHGVYAGETWGVGSFPRHAFAGRARRTAASPLWVHSRDGGYAPFSVLVRDRWRSASCRVTSSSARRSRNTAPKNR